MKRFQFLPFILAALGVGSLRAAPQGPCGCEDIPTMETRLKEKTKLAECAQAILVDCYAPSTGNDKCPADGAAFIAREVSCGFGDNAANVQVAGSASTNGSSNTNSNVSQAYADANCNEVVSYQQKHEDLHIDYAIHNFPYMLASVLAVPISGTDPNRTMMRHLAISEHESYTAEKELVAKELDLIKSRCPKDWIGWVSYKHTTTSESETDGPGMGVDAKRHTEGTIVNHYETVVRIDMARNTATATVTADQTMTNLDETDGKVDCNDNPFKPSNWRAFHQEGKNTMKSDAPGLDASAIGSIVVKDGRFHITATVNWPEGGKTEIVTESRNTGGCGSAQPPSSVTLPAGPWQIMVPTAIDVEGALDPSTSGMIMGSKNENPPPIVLGTESTSESTTTQWLFTMGK